MNKAGTLYNRGKCGIWVELRVTGGMVDGVIMAIGVMVAEVMVTKVTAGIADSTFPG